MTATQPAPAASTQSGPQPSAYTRVIVGVNDTTAGVAALKWAVALARSRHARLVAVHSWMLGESARSTRRHRHRTGPRRGFYVAGLQQHQAGEQLVRRAFRAALGRFPDDLDVTVETPEGEPGAVLTNMSTAPGDILVVGTGAASGLQRAVRGSVSRYCTRHSCCPVMVVPASQADSPERPIAQSPLSSTGSG